MTLMQMRKHALHLYGNQTLATNGTITINQYRIVTFLSTIALLLVLTFLK
jgi:hypothetical protein